MLLARAASAAILAPLVVALVWRGGPLFVVVVAAVGGWCAFEYARLLERGGFRPAWPIAVAGAAALIVSPAAPGAHLGGLALAAVIFGPGIYLLAEGVAVSRALYDWALTSLGALLVGWPLAQAVALRGTAGEAMLFGFDAQRGALIVLTALTLTWISDTGAYAVGRLIGKRPFFPEISPRKTAEGAVAAVAAPCLLALVWAGPIGWPLAFAGVLGALAGVAAVAGDLLESMIKRAVGAKDAGGLIPGHGGVLDRVDSLLLVLVTVALLTGQLWP